MAANHRFSFPLPSFILCSIVLLAKLASAGCFFPDGTDRNLAANATYPYEYYSPCNNQTGVVSMCCAIGPGRVATDDADTCTSNGLCLSSDGLTWWRESCTDPTWKDPACVQLYVDGQYDGEAESANDVPMTLCADGSYCTGTGTTSAPCCLNNQGLFVLSNLTVTSQNPNSTASASSSSSSASSTSIASSTSSLASTTTPPATSATATAAPSSSGLSTGDKAGIGIGAAVVALAALGLLFWVFSRRRAHARGRQVGEKSDVASSSPASPPKYAPPGEASSTPIHETYGSPVSRPGPHFPEPVEMEQPDARIPWR